MTVTAVTLVYALALAAYLSLAVRVLRRSPRTSLHWSCAAVLVTLALPGRRSGRGSADPQALPAWENLRRVLREPGVRAGALGMALLGVPFSAFIVFLPLLGAARGLSGTGWVFAAYALAASLTQPAAGPPLSPPQAGGLGGAGGQGGRPGWGWRWPDWRWPGWQRPVASGRSSEWPCCSGWGMGPRGPGWT